jgi:hypothetical protein
MVGHDLAICPSHSLYALLGLETLGKSARPDPARTEKTIGGSIRSALSELSGVVLRLFQAQWEVGCRELTNCLSKRHFSADGEMPSLCPSAMVRLPPTLHEVDEAGIAANAHLRGGADSVRVRQSNEVEGICRDG